MRTEDVEKSKHGAWCLGEPMSGNVSAWHTDETDPQAIEKVSKQYFRKAQDEIKNSRKTSIELSTAPGYILHKDSIYRQYPNGMSVMVTGDNAREIKRIMSQSFQKKTA